MLPIGRKEKLKEVEEKLGYEFKNPHLLNLAFVHSSYGNEVNSYRDMSNERLEFLGDAVLELIVSNFLFYELKESPEGDLTKIRSQLVCEKSFANWAKKFQFGDYLLMGKGEEKSGGRERDSVLADSLEAFCGALYLDSDFKTAQKIVEKNFLRKIDLQSKSQDRAFDYKTRLQEYCQKRSQERVQYFVIAESGPDHDKVFTMGVRHSGRKMGEGIGKNKKEAEQMAAKNALKELEK